MFLKDVALNTWTRESVYTFGGNHIVWLLFYPANDCIFFCKQLVEDISVHHVNYCFFNELICSENWCGTDGTNRLPYSYSEDEVRGVLLLDLTWLPGPEAASTITPEDLRTAANCWNGSKRRAYRHVTAPSVMSIRRREAYAHNISVNWVFTLVDSKN